MLDLEFDYYLANQESFAKVYPNKYLIIVGDAVVAVYPSYEEALYKAKQSYDKGKFLIQYCASGTGAYTATFHSNVLIDNA